MGPSLRRIFVTISSISLLVLVFYFAYSGNELFLQTAKPIQIKWVEGSRGFVLNTPGCQIPDWDPYDSTVLPLFSKIKSPYKCPGRPQFMKTKPNAVISVDYDLLSMYYDTQKDNLSCTYHPILRDPSPEDQRTDDKFVFGDYKELEFGVSLKEEFIVVKCSTRDVQNFTQYIPLVPLKPDVEKVKSQKSETSSDETPLNIIFVGIDSISKLNFLRHFDKTRKFLQEHLNPFELKGYTKVADNTFPNLTPLLTGHFIEHYWNENMKSFFFDDIDFIWKNFSKRGYRTLFVEDAPDMATFNLLKNGFRNPPTDYYFRPFALAVEKSIVRQESKVNCLHSQLEMDILYNYLRDFVRTMEERPYFAFTFVARLTHDNLNSAGYADEPTFHLLKDLHSEGVLNKSLLVLFSDHGIRFGPIRQTYIGKFEERMPFIYLNFPPWFLKKYPEFEKNLRENQNRLTTPFDVHATLVHLMQLKPQPSSELNETLSILTPHGMSLMNPIPSDRTCSKASILPHWCTCQTHKPVAVTEPIVINCAIALVDTLNKILKPFYDACATLRLKEIFDARFSQANDNVLRFVKHQNDVINRQVVLGDKINAPVDYLIIIEVEPGEGVFEGTVRYDSEDGTYKVLDDISRINMYGNQSICIENSRIRKFCYCKSQDLNHTLFRTMKNSSHT